MMTTSDVLRLREELVQLRAKHRALHEIVQRREAKARDVIEAGATREELLHVVEGLIVDGADACEQTGPCPACAAKERA